MDQKELINKINNAIPEALAASTADFYIQKTDENSKGLWLRGSEDYAKDGKRIFNYEENDDNKILHPVIAKIIKNTGWYVEPYDAGTCMLFLN